MSTRKLLLTVALTAAAPLSALAAGPVYGEADYRLVDAPKVSLTRAEKIAQDRAQAAAEAARVSGWRRVNGEPGWVYEGHKYARVNGELVCVDGIDHTTRASFEPLRDALLFRGA